MEPIYGAADAKQHHSPARRVRLMLLAMPLLALTALFSSAKCYPEGTRIVIFVQGIYTGLDASGTQGSLVENHRFENLKAAFLARGYDQSALLDFSYEGGAVAPNGAWQPKPYGCEITDRLPDENLKPLEAMLKDLRGKHPRAHFTLVGHSLGGYLVFLEGAREAARVPGDKLDIDVVVTLDAPLKGVSADKKIIFDILRCEKTYAAGADLVAQRLDPGTADVRRYQAAVMAQEGVRLATLGNAYDCVWNTAHCIAAGDWIDDSDTQFLDGQASISRTYYIDTTPFGSHEIILADSAVVRDAIAFVGAP